MPKGYPKNKGFVQLGLTETDAYAVLTVLKTTLEVESQQPIPPGFKGFTARLFRKSLTDVKDALESVLEPETPTPAPTN